ncbi:MAG: hypothetical protein AAB538_06085 [Patescibacteria group bacterium]
MSQKVLLGIGLITGFILAAAAASYCIHISAYFMWGLVPDAPLKVYVDGGEAVELLESLRSQYHLDELSALPLGSISRVVYTRSGSGESAVLLPKLSTFYGLPANLTEQGWHSRRLGLLVLASRREDALQGKSSQLLLAGLKHLPSWLFHDRLPLRPTLLASLSASAFPVLPGDFHLVAELRNDMLVVAGSEGKNWPSAEKVPPFTLPAGFQVSVPGSYLAALPTPVRQVWNQYFWQRFGLRSSKPDLVEALAAFDHIEAGINHEARLGTVRQEESFIVLADSWVGEEVAHAHPVTRAFRLPDGTIGYEKRPAALVPAFTTPPDDQGCRNSELSLFLCQTPGRAVLSTTPALTTLASSPPPASLWHVSLSAEIMQKLSLPRLFGLLAWGDGRQVSLVFPLSAEQK